jgi:osmoprotectant transport system substrate-binding protein
VLSQLRRTSRPLAASAVLSASAFALAACGIHDPVLDPPQAGEYVVVGSANSAHSELIAEIYAGAMAHTGASVQTDLGIGDRQETLSALDSGRVTLIPEQSGALLDYLDPSAKQTRPDDVFVAVNRALPEGLAVSDYAMAQPGSVDENDPAQNVLPVFRAGSLNDAQMLKLNVVAGELTSADLDTMTNRVEAGAKSADVAADWLGSRGI